MTVRELIDRLVGVPGDTEVTVYGSGADGNNVEGISDHAMLVEGSVWRFVIVAGVIKTDSKPGEPQ